MLQQAAAVEGDLNDQLNRPRTKFTIELGACLPSFREIATIGFGAAGQLGLLDWIGVASSRRTIKCTTVRGIVSERCFMIQTAEENSFALESHGFPSFRQTK